MRPNKSIDYKFGRLTGFEGVFHCKHAEDGDRENPTPLGGQSHD
jgi:hypothetical protein